MASKKAVQPELAPAVTPVVVEAPTVATEAVQPVAAPAVQAAPTKQEVTLIKLMLAWRERKVNGEGIEQSDRPCGFFFIWNSSPCHLLITPLQLPFPTVVQ